MKKLIIPAIAFVISCVSMGYYIKGTLDNKAFEKRENFSGQIVRMTNKFTDSYSAGEEQLSKYFVAPGSEGEMSPKTVLFFMEGAGSSMRAELDKLYQQIADIDGASAEDGTEKRNIYVSAVLEYLAVYDDISLDYDDIYDLMADKGPPFSRLIPEVNAILARNTSKLEGYYEAAEFARKTYVHDE